MLNLVEKRNILSNLEQIAEYFEIPLDKSNDASTIIIDNHKAKGFISAYKLFKGLSVLVYNITFQSDFKINLELSKESPYYFCYTVKGHFFHRLNNEIKYDKILQNQNLLVTGGAETSAQIIYPAKIKHKIVTIIVKLKSLENQDIRNAKRIYSSIKEIFTKIPKHAAYKYLGSIDPETEKYASVVCENNNTDIVGELLTEGAILNMFASQIKTYKKDITKTNTESTLSNTELSKITNLGDYVIKRLQTGITIIKLSHHFKISPKKLQIGVRHLYGDSVGSYVFNLRLGKAKQLFDTTDLNITQVRKLVGIASASNFSVVFKKRYGMLPSQYKNNIK
jgi:AraC-like DNA-binding protein